MALEPSGRVTSTVEPASALPVTASSPAVTGFTVGATGAVVSGTVTLVGVDVLFEASFAVTDTVSFSFKALTGTLKLPSWSAVADALVPSGRVTSTVEPASAVPVTAVSPALTGFTTGASGAVLSSAFATVAVVGVDVLFEASFAVTETV